VLRVLDGHRVVTIATNRPDGWPQTTMVGYINDGFLIEGSRSVVGQR